MKKQTAGSMSPMDYAMKYLTLKDRTVSEMQAYLDEKDFGEADVDATIARLQELGLLDDRRYAQRFVETRLASKPVSRRHLYEQMKGHGISEEYIREAGKDKDSYSAVYLSGYGDRELAVEQWLSADGTPLYADLWFGIENAAGVTIRDFSLGEPTE